MTPLPLAPVLFAILAALSFAFGALGMVTLHLMHRMKAADQRIRELQDFGRNMQQLAHNAELGAYTGAPKDPMRRLEALEAWQKALQPLLEQAHERSVETHRVALDTNDVVRGKYVSALERAGACTAGRGTALQMTEICGLALDHEPPCEYIPVQPQPWPDRRLQPGLDDPTI